MHKKKKEKDYKYENKGSSDDSFWLTSGKAHWPKMISQLLKDIYQGLGIFKDLGNFPF